MIEPPKGVADLRDLVFQTSSSSESIYFTAMLSEDLLVDVIHTIIYDRLYVDVEMMTYEATWLQPCSTSLGIPLRWIRSMQLSASCEFRRMMNSRQRRTK